MKLAARVAVLILMTAALLPARPLRAQVSPGPLARAHASLDGITKCLNCHEAGQELSGRKCLACHVSLAGRIAANAGFHGAATRGGAALQCATCHSEHNGRPWQLARWPGNAPKERFDHARTGYTLEGAHARLDCNDCHRAGLIADADVRRDSSLSVERTFLGLGTACPSCHVDEHRGRTSGPCTGCHTQASWKPAPGFDHARTRFALEGRHRAVECRECHAVRTEISRGPGGAADTTFVDFRGAQSAAGGCASCHTNPHRQPGRCESCHTVNGWFSLPDSLRRFDHAPTGFVLRGAHAGADCESCHWPSANRVTPARAALARANFLRPLNHQRLAFESCASCHAQVHQLELGERGQDCAACHGEEHFAPTEYGPASHDSTGFPLTGAHLAVPCTACHVPLTGASAGAGRVRFRLDGRSCAGCHRDPHGGQFAGKGCNDCHSTDAWIDARGAFDHERTRYPLRGAHASVACSRCHKSGGARAATFRGLPTTCGAAGCHGDPHAGQFAGRARGSECVTCHDEQAFKPAHLDHQTDTDWPLDGAHRRAACTACHRPQGTPAVIRWRPMPHRCEDCHTAPPGRRT